MVKTEYKFQQALYMYICNIIFNGYKFKICTTKTKTTSFYSGEHMTAKIITHKEANEQTKFKKKNHFRCDISHIKNDKHNKVERFRKN